MALSLSEAAQRAGVNRSTILRRIRRGVLSASKSHDGEWRIDPAELQRHLDNEVRQRREAREGTHPHAHRSAHDYAPPETHGSGNGADDKVQGVHNVAGNSAPVAQMEDAATAALIARLEVENEALKERLDETREDRDRWHEAHTRLVLAPPSVETPAPARRGLLARLLS